MDHGPVMAKVPFLFTLQVNRLDKEGYYGGVRLLMSTCKVFLNYCKENNIDLHNRNFTLSYDTNIPRQVELLDCYRTKVSSY